MSLGGGPVGFDFYDSADAVGVVEEAGPGPVFGFCGEAAFDGVTVHVDELLVELAVGEDVEVVVAGLPEGALRGLDGDGQFEGLEGFGEENVAGFAEEKVDVLGHDDVAADEEVVALADCFEGSLE